MYEIHRTVEGREMLVAEMDNDHLLNTIRRICRKIGEAIQIINLDEDIKPDKVIAQLQPRYSAESLLTKAKIELEEMDEKLPFYVVEAVLRGLDISSILQKAYQREAKIGNSFPGFNTEKLIEAQEE